MLCLCLPLHAQTAQETKVDYSQVSAPILNFEKLIGDIIRATLPGEFGVVQRPKGALVPDAGYVFTFLVNMNRGLIHSPMGTFSDPSSLSPAKKREKIETLRDLLTRLLYSQGNTLTQLKRDKTITIIAFFEDTSPEEETVSKRLILSVMKGDVDDSIMKQQGINEFKSKVKIIEY
jgi:hypothetical protein